MTSTKRDASFLKIRMVNYTGQVGGRVLSTFVSEAGEPNKGAKPNSAASFLEKYARVIDFDIFSVWTWWACPTTRQDYGELGRTSDSPRAMNIDSVQQTIRRLRLTWWLWHSVRLKSKVNTLFMASSRLIIRLISAKWYRQVEPELVPDLVTAFGPSAEKSKATRYLVLESDATTCGGRVGDCIHHAEAESLHRSVLASIERMIGDQNTANRGTRRYAQSLPPIISFAYRWWTGV
jgi:hypothetical protein